MTLETLAWILVGLAGIPAVLFLVNLTVYRRPPRRIRETGATAPAISVLIPARNEANNIRAAVASVLANPGVDLEVIVLDDHSEDRTAEVVREMAGRDRRLRLAIAPALPAGWCGKQHACHVLASLARHPLLLFMDADVRLEPAALARLGEFMRRHQTALASGVPRQVTLTWAERLLIPLVHFLLLGYLPMVLARRSRHPAFAAGCGQLFIARAREYAQAGGHAAIRATWHDGVKLPRLFRKAGFHTELFDATDLASCRMYHHAGEVWNGLLKNATEGIAAPGVIWLWTLLLAGGHVLPFLLLPAAPFLPANVVALAATAAALSWLPRLIGTWRFQQPVGFALLQPLSVGVFLIAQWTALIRSWRHLAPSWKGRTYAPTPSITPGKAAA